MTMTAVAAAQVVLGEASRVASQRQLRHIERAYAQRIRRAFRAQARLFIPRWLAHQKSAPVAHIREAGVDDGTWVLFFEEAVRQSETLFRTPTAEAAQQAMQVGARSVPVPSIGVELAFDVVTDPRAIDYVQTRGINLIRELSDTTRARVRAVVAEGIEKGWSPQRVASELRKLYSGFFTPAAQRHIRDRAELIAITEMGEAYSFAALEQARDLQSAGLPMEKAWQTVGDTRVDLPHCRANEAQGWIPLRDQFQSGHDRPLSHPGCRCSLLVQMRTEGS